MISYENSPVGQHLTDAANEFDAVRIQNYGHGRFVAIDEDGGRMRMIADEGIGSTEFECDEPAAFEAAWDAVCSCSGCGEYILRDEAEHDAVSGPMCSDCFADVR